MTHAKLLPHYGQTDAKVNIVLILVIEEHSLIIGLTVPCKYSNNNKYGKRNIVAKNHSKLWYSNVLISIMIQTNH